jgi:hypothetical protein
LAARGPLENWVADELFDFPPASEPADIFAELADHSRRLRNRRETGPRRRICRAASHTLRCIAQARHRHWAPSAGALLTPGCKYSRVELRPTRQVRASTPDGRFAASRHAHLPRFQLVANSSLLVTPTPAWRTWAS